MITPIQSSAFLQQYISCMLYFNGPVDAMSMQCIPRGKPALACIFKAAPDYRLIIAFDQEKNFSAITDLYLFGQFSGSWTHEMSGVHEFLLVVLKSEALSLIIRDKSDLVTNKFVSLSNWYAESRLVMDQISESAGIVSKISILYI
jgi:hypothetical protein